jgi:tetratricopeptide (TPR) repeat protein
MKQYSPPLAGHDLMSGNSVPIFRPFELLSACFAFSVALSVYIFSLAPTITFGDSGELITAAVTLGIAHPPGYPLWLLAAKLFSLLPIGSVAYRLNLMSAFLDASAVGLLSLVIAKTLPQVGARIIPRENFDSPLVGIIVGSAAATATLCLAFSPTFWQQAVAAEVYALNNFIICLILLLMILWSASPQKDGLLFLMAFLFGAGLGNHQTLGLLAPAAGLYVVLVRPKALLSPRTVIGCGAFFFLGLLLYAYLPIRALSNPPLNWGDPKTWNNFWFHVLRKQYRILGVVRPLSVISGQLRFLFSSTSRESLPLVLLVPALVTAAFANKTWRNWLIFTVAAFVCTGVLLMIIANTELDLNAQELLKIYFLPPWIIVAVWIGYGIAMINLLALRASRRMRRHAFPSLLLAALWLLLPTSSIVANHRVASMHRHDFGRRYGDAMLNSMREGGVLFAGTDSAYAIPMYMKWVAEKRPDVIILSVNRLSDRSYRAEALRNTPNIPFLTQEDYTEALSLYAAAPATFGGGVYGSQRVNQLNAYLLLKLYRRISPERPLYYDQGIPIDWVCDYAVPCGLLMELKKTKVDTITPEMVAYDTEYWRFFEEKLLGKEHFLEDTAARQKFSKCRSNIGYLYLRRKIYPEAEQAFEQAIRFSDRNIEAYAFLALAYKEQGEREKAISIFNDYLQRDTWNTSARAFARSLEG